MRISLREKRQITLPAAICNALGIEPGDQIEANVEDGTLVIRPARKASLEALKELRRAFAEADVSEEEWLAGTREVREDLFREKYPELAKRHRA